VGGGVSTGAGVRTGAVDVAAPVLGGFWANKAPAGMHTSTAAAATTIESFCISTSRVAPPCERKVT
jgi:hypothetical protein